MNSHINREEGNQLSDVVRTIEQEKIISIIRSDYPEEIENVVTSLYEGGVRVIEVTMITPSALKTIEFLSTHFPNIHIGAGTVLDPETARSAVLSGAAFLLTPTLHPGTIQMANRYQVPIIPGVFTPTEVLTAAELGADVVKIFPVGTLGPRYIKELKGPLSHIEMIPVGGVTNDNAIEFLEVGSFALGMGSHLVNDQLIVDKNFLEIRRRAESLVKTISKFRSSV